MRKIAFCFSGSFSILLLVKIIPLLTTDFNRLTNFGFGYLSGLIVLFLIMLALCILTGRSLLKN